MASSSVAPSASSLATESCAFHVKWQVEDDGPAVATVLQGRNGPCPLLALANALLLLRTIRMPISKTSISVEELLSLICHDERALELYEVLPRLAREVPVDLLFRGTTEFVPSEELKPFEKLGIRLVHAALPDSDLVLDCVSPFSYNEVVDALCTGQAAQMEPSGPSASPVDDSTPGEAGASPSSPGLDEADNELVSNGAWELPRHLRDDDSPSADTEQASNDSEDDGVARIIANAAFVQDFLDSNPSMMTWRGLAALHETLREGEVAVLFYSAHFSVLKKHEGKLFTLVTDAGFLRESDIMWESLNDIGGDTAYFNAQFRPSRTAAGSRMQVSTTAVRGGNEVGNMAPLGGRANNGGGPSSGRVNQRPAASQTGASNSGGAPSGRQERPPSRRRLSSCRRQKTSKCAIQ